MTQPRQLTETLRREAQQLGFVHFGVTPAVVSTGFPNLVDWIESGFAGEMSYFQDRQEAYRHPSGVLPAARSIVVLVYPYAAANPPPIEMGEAKIARYVWGKDDYHDVIHPKLKRLCRIIRQSSPDAKTRGIVDTAPLMEREFAELAGLGWRGKNTLLLNKYLGSYFFLACLLTSLDLPSDAPHETSHCGTCTACLQACPTDAFPQPGVLDATRCISYLTIEHRDSIPMELRPGIGDWLFGCDVCQEVCPWNSKPSHNADTPLDPLDRLQLVELFAIDDETFRERFRKTPLWRTRRRGILRNAAIVLGNQSNEESVAALTRGLNDAEPLVRGASAWALGQIGSLDSLDALRTRSEMETDPETSREIENALSCAES